MTWTSRYRIFQTFVNLEDLEQAIIRLEPRDQRLVLRNFGEIIGAVKIGCQLFYLTTKSLKFSSLNAALAQLVERVFSKDKVDGSTPSSCMPFRFLFSSTIFDFFEK